VENFSEYLVPGSVGAVVAVGLMRLISKVLDWAMQRDKREGEEEREYRAQFFANYDNLQARVEELEKKDEKREKEYREEREKRDREYKELQDENLELSMENLRLRARIEDLERDVKTFMKRIQELEKELEYERQGE
jgi:predicted nuclease with TOPRIM domain